MNRNFQCFVIAIVTTFNPTVTSVTGIRVGKIKRSIASPVCTHTHKQRVVPELVRTLRKHTPQGLAGAFTIATTSMVVMCVCECGSRVVVHCRGNNDNVVVDCITTYNNNVKIK